MDSFWLTLLFSSFLCLGFAFGNLKCLHDSKNGDVVLRAVLPERLQEDR
jgi:hypothetical protein